VVRRRKKPGSPPSNPSPLREAGSGAPAQSHAGAEPSKAQSIARDPFLAQVAATNETILANLAEFAELVAQSRETSLFGSIGYLDMETGEYVSFVSLQELQSKIDDLGNQWRLRFPNHSPPPLPRIRSRRDALSAFDSLQRRAEAVADGIDKKSWITVTAAIQKARDMGIELDKAFFSKRGDSDDSDVEVRHIPPGSKHLRVNEATLDAHLIQKVKKRVEDERLEQQFRMLAGQQPGNSPKSRALKNKTVLNPTLDKKNKKFEQLGLAVRDGHHQARPQA
jgi:hypothetical protein